MLRLSSLQAVLDGLAVFRLTKLVVDDSITAPLRERLIGRTYSQDRMITGERMPMAARPKMAVFITCPWCTSPYLAVLVVLLQTFLPVVCLYVTAVLAFSAVAGLLSGLA